MFWSCVVLCGIVLCCTLSIVGYRVALVQKLFHMWMYCCNVAVCQSCSGFKSSYTCGCGEKYSDHHMVVETKEEREARGHPVGLDNPYKAMGGLTGFSSLAEGYMRLDPSGRGRWSVF